jgi:pilus assembly protein Flp/PilA
MSGDITGNSISSEPIMKSLKSAVKNFVSNEDGAALVEYALLVALIAIICILGVTFLGKTVSTKFKNIGDSLANS